MRQRSIQLAVCYGQVSQTLLDEAAPIWSERPDFVVAWTRPEGVLEAFRRMLDCCSVSEKDLNEKWMHLPPLCYEQVGGRGHVRSNLGYFSISPDAGAVGSLCQQGSR